MHEQVDKRVQIDIPAKFDLQGAKLTSITQAIAYEGLKELAPNPKRNTTNLNLEKVRREIAECTGTQETNEAIWNHIRTN
jgi:hypothetical protein